MSHTACNGSSRTWLRSHEYTLYVDFTVSYCVSFFHICISVLSLVCFCYLGTLCCGLMKPVRLFGLSWISTPDTYIIDNRKMLGWIFYVCIGILAFLIWFISSQYTSKPLEFLWHNCMTELWDLECKAVNISLINDGVFVHVGERGVPTAPHVPRIQGHYLYRMRKST